MAVQQFCLRWNNHQPNFISVFSNLLNSESLVDVTLAAEGKHLQAHKVVLSACSSYFQSLFTVNPCQHPIVILKDIKYTDLKIMVDFMYCGEVNVSQEQLPAVLKTAETLKVKGLAEMPEHNISLSVSNDKNNSDSPSPSPSMLRRKRLRKSSTGSGSGSTEQTTTGGSEETVGSAVASPSPITIKAEPFSEGEGSLRNEPSTDSEHGFPSQDSVEDDISQPHLSSQQNQQPSVQSNHTQPGQQQGSGQGQGQQSHHSQHQSSTSTEDRNDTGMGHSSSMEDNSPSTTSQPHYSPGWPYHHYDYLPSRRSPNPVPTAHRQSPPPRRRRTNPQQSENFHNALEAVRVGGLGFCKAARLFGVNNRTLWLEYKRLGYPVQRRSVKTYNQVTTPQPMSSNNSNVSSVSNTSSTNQVTSSSKPPTSPSSSYTPNSVTSTPSSTVTAPSGPTLVPSFLDSSFAFQSQIGSNSDRILQPGGVQPLIPNQSFNNISDCPPTPFGTGQLLEIPPSPRIRRVNLNQM